MLALDSELSSDQLLVFLGHTDDAWAESEAIQNLERQLQEELLDIVLEAGVQSRFRRLYIWAWRRSAKPEVGGQHAVVRPFLDRADIGVFVFRSKIGSLAWEELNYLRSRAIPIVALFPWSVPEPEHFNDEKYVREWGDLLAKRNSLSVDWNAVDSNSVVPLGGYKDLNDLCQKVREQFRRMVPKLMRQPAVVLVPSRVDAFIDELTDWKEFDPETVGRFRKVLRDEARSNLPASLSDAEFLSAIGVWRFGSLTRLGILLFVRRPSAHSSLPFSWLRLARYPGESKGDEIERKDIGSPLQEQIEEAMGFIATCIEKIERVQEGVSRTVTEYSYPMKCVREVLANAICHRNYEDQSYPTAVRIFANRIEIQNSGQWPGLNLKDAIGTESMNLDEIHSDGNPVNPRLSHLLSLVDLVEMEGRGLPLAILDCENSGARIPHVKEGIGKVSVTIWPKPNWKRQGNGAALGTSQAIHLFQTLVQDLAASAPPVDLEKGMARYQRYLIERHTHLEFRGMGVDRLALHLPLLEVYVPGRARVRAPQGDSWTRDEVRIGGREPSDEEIAAIGEHGGPVPVLDLLRQKDGLVLLGDPGSGKTTFLKYLALTAARGESEQLGIGLRLPLLAPLAAYAARLFKEPGLGLQTFLAEQLAEQGVEADAERLLTEGLRRGRMLILLDGLDEVSDEAHRHKVANRVKDFYSAIRPDGNKLVATSRIVGYAEVRLQAEKLGEGTLVDLDSEEIETFVTAWTAAVERSARGQGEAAAFDAEREKKGLLAAIELNPGVKRLAANPLLLTVLALMKRQGVELPDQRAELYATYVRVLIHQWNLARSISGQSFAGLDFGETLDLLAPLALWMQEISGARGMVSEEALRDELVTLMVARGELAPNVAAANFLADVRLYTALLIDRGSNVFGFIHLTFQEYLAAVALVRTGQVELAPLIDSIAFYVGKPEWLEVIRLAVGDLARERPEAAGKVLHTLLGLQPGAPGEVEVFAGLAALDVGRKGLPAESRARTVGALLMAMRDDSRVPPGARARAGDVLADLGDPRTGVISLGEMELCWVPAGSFWMGSREDDEEAYVDEKPQHELTLAHPFAIGRYPVTVAQYAEYVERSGAQPGNRDSLLGTANAPVVWVSWHEALGFCHWLTDTWRSEGKLAPEGEVRLPSEAEWEKSARGGLEIPTGPSFLSVGAISEAMASQHNPRPERIYPWVGAFEPNRANSVETKIGRVSAVGCFPGGASPYGVEDLSGNLKEWTRSTWGPVATEPQYCYPYDAQDGREDLESTSLRVVRGGAFHNVPGFVRCASRFKEEPDSRSASLGFRVVVSPSLSRT